MISTAKRIVRVFTNSKWNQAIEVRSGASLPNEFKYVYSEPVSNKDKPYPSVFMCVAIDHSLYQNIPEERLREILAKIDRLNQQYVMELHELKQMIGTAIAEKVMDE